MTAETFSKTNGNADGAVDFRAVAERWNVSGRQAAERALDLYGTTIDNVTDAHVKAAGKLDQPAVSKVAEAQASFVSDLADAYISYYRTLLAP